MITDTLSQAHAAHRDALINALQTRAIHRMIADLDDLKQSGWIDAELADEIADHLLRRPAAPDSPQLPRETTLPVPLAIAPAMTSAQAAAPNPPSAGRPRTSRSQRDPRWYTQGRTCPVCGVEITDKATACPKHAQRGRRRPGHGES